MRRFERGVRGQGSGVRGQERGQGSGDRGQEEGIYVLELGIGVGLFARFFLDHFRALCLEHGEDFYDRLCYIAADKSERMLMDVARYGVLANHAGHYRLRLVDATEPEKVLPHDIEWRERGQGSGVRSQRRSIFHAVFLNYLLDCLPAAVLEVNGDEVKQLCVRTLVGRNIKLENTPT